PEVSRHLAAFLAQHAGDRLADGDAALGFPDAVLFNGGALTPAVLRTRLCDVLASWNGGRPLTVLESASLDLAVARGAAYYGLVRRGLGVRIGGGSPRAFYLGLAPTPDLPAEMVDAVCLVARGQHEGEEVEITSAEFTVLANRPVSFPL